MPFIVGESYTRDHIHDVLGGEKVSYLPQKEGKIVCGCFSPDSNPEAPFVILVGGDHENDGLAVAKKANILEVQDEPIPVFLKHASNDWQFEGSFRVRRVNRDRTFLEEKQRRAQRTDVIMALILEPVESTPSTYLLTWNPNNWPWDNLEDAVRVTAEGRPVDDRWSCGNTKRIRVGDRLFLSPRRRAQGNHGSRMGDLCDVRRTALGCRATEQGRDRSFGRCPVRADFEPRL